MESDSKNIESRATKNRIRQLMEFDLRISKDKFPKIIPFILFLSFLMILYIANKNYSEKCVLEMNKLNQELKDLRAESLTIKADLMNKTKQSEVERLAKSIGLKGVTKPHKKIIKN